MRRWWSCSAVRWAEAPGEVVAGDCGDCAATGSDMVSAVRRTRERMRGEVGTEDSFGMRIGKTEGNYRL
jgi:hypothetical protein